MRLGTKGLLVASLAAGVILLVRAQSTQQPAVMIVSGLRYDPVPYTCTTGGTVQLRDGYNVFDINGGVVLGCTVNLPVHPDDAGFYRLSINIAITTLTVADPNGTTVPFGVQTSLGAGATPSWQWQAQTGSPGYRKIGA